MEGPFSGSCLCRKVRFEVAEFEPTVAHCHCTMCRKFHGAAFATIAGVPTGNFRWEQGEEYLKTFTAENKTERTFCSECGSSLTFRSASSPDGHVEVALGVMDTDLPVLADAHIYTDSQVNWIEGNDCLIRYRQGRGSDVKS